MAFLKLSPTETAQYSYVARLEGENMNAKTETCPTCKSTGVLANTHTGSPEVCPRCGGEGEVEARFNRVPYDFVFPRTTIVLANGTNQVSIQSPKDADFEWWDIVGNSTGGFDVKLEINAETMMNAGQQGNASGIASVNWMGTAQLPSARRVPYILPKGTQVVLYFTDTSAAPNNAIQVAFRGFLLEKLAKRQAS